jgi:hypothetical protein
MVALVATDARSALGKLALGASLLLACCVVLERFTTWYQGGALLPKEPFETATLAVACTVPQLFWSQRARQLAPACAAVAALAWLLRLVMLVGPQRHGALPSAWADSAPTLLDGGMLVGSLTVFFAFCRRNG